MKEDLSEKKKAALESIAVLAKTVTDEEVEKIAFFALGVVASRKLTDAA